MAYPASPALPLTDRQRRLLDQHARKTTVAQREVFRCRVILNGADGLSDERSAKQLGRKVLAFKKWRKRWLAGYDKLTRFEQGVQEQEGQGLTDLALLRQMLSVLGDALRSGRPKVITEAQEQQIVALSCERPAQYGLAVSTWTQALLAHQAIELGIVPTISAHHIGVILKKMPEATPGQILAFSHYHGLAGICGYSQHHLCYH